MTAHETAKKIKAHVRKGNQGAAKAAWDTYVYEGETEQAQQQRRGRLMSFGIYWLGNGLVVSR